MHEKELVTLLAMAAGLFCLIQFRAMKFWHAALVFGAGFYLAIGTPAGPQVSDFVTRILHSLGH